MPNISGIPNLLNLSLIKSEQPLFFSENDADTPASKNIKDINHGEINTTIDAIGLTLSKKYIIRLSPRIVSYG